MPRRRVRPGTEARERFLNRLPVAVDEPLELDRPGAAAPRFGRRSPLALLRVAPVEQQSPHDHGEEGPEGAPAGEPREDVVFAFGQPQVHRLREVLAVLPLQAMGTSHGGDDGVQEG